MASAAPSPAASASKPQAGTQSSKRSGKQAKKKTRGGIERACKVDSGDSSPVCRRYVVQFTFDHLEHALPEFDAILRALGVDADSCYEHPFDVGETPFLVATLPSDDVAREIARRAVLVTSVCQLWGYGSDIDEVLASTDEFPAEEKERFYKDELCWSLDVITFGSKQSMKQKEVTRRRFKSHIVPRGRVNPKHPDVAFRLFEDRGEKSVAQWRANQSFYQFIPPTDGLPYDSSTPDKEITARGGKPKGIRTPETVAAVKAATSRLRAAYMGRLVATSTAKDLVEKLSLRYRRYLGPTSLPADLALIMANMGGVSTGSVVLDPFCGTGSILVACSARGASGVFGCDIDMRSLKGVAGGAKVVKGKRPRTLGMNIFTNFDDYGLPHPEIIRTDASLSSLRAHRTLWDAIICDPPYGKRAGAKRQGARSQDRVKPISAKQRQNHFAQTRQYHPADVMKDLLSLAARKLVMGGRLVYLLPVHSRLPYNIDRDLPRHPCLKRVAVAGEYLKCGFTRFMVTMEKIKEVESSDGSGSGSGGSGSSSKVEATATAGYMNPHTNVVREHERTAAQQAQPSTTDTAETGSKTEGSSSSSSVMRTCVDSVYSHPVLLTAAVATLFTLAAVSWRRR